MGTSAITLLLADDDIDDCMFFKDALEELPLATNLTTISDGVELMRYLTSQGDLPDVIFLDLNMPRKNGYECLSEIKQNFRLAAVPVIIYSTSFDTEVVDLLFEKGARHYIRKPGDFSKIKEVIHRALLTIRNSEKMKTAKDKFVIQPV